MNAFDIFRVAQSGMDRQQQTLHALGAHMATMPAQMPADSGFAQHLQQLEQHPAGEPGAAAAADQPVQDDVSWLGTVLGVTESLRLYRMNATVANAAKSMIERSLDISGK
ncbi:hypothetical protein [Andreprevotia chitinilytica]|uniref:hypothetical protein n=1 Tax=Andreprevotia chitinilytica TaxID=396808 RepID=UPI0005526C84|nr:hypothetical protein [Andreprevotia chitinilytica]